MGRFEALLSEYVEGRLDTEGRGELGSLIGSDRMYLDAFLDAVSDERIRKMELERT